MKMALKAALVLASALTATSAWATTDVNGADYTNQIATVSGKLAAKEYAQSYMTYRTTAEVASSRTTGYSGVGSLFVSYVSTATTGFGSLCTGSLIGATTVLTAAHCLDGGSDPVTAITFYLPSFGDRGAATTRTFAASAFALAPEFLAAGDDGLVSGHDMAAFTISGDTSAYDKYGLYLGNPLQQYLEVGTGTVGGPQGTGIGVTNDYRKRTGSNLYEYYGDDIFSDVGHGVVLYDFDDGTAAHDVFGRNCIAIGETAATCKNQLGITGESAASPGDSGGPEFINGQIASVTSFGITGGIFDNFCGGTSTDPYNKSGTTTVSTLGNCTNSSVGEIGGNTLVSANLAFIRGYLAGTVTTTALPEPTTWAMMIAGFGMVGGSMRRRAKTKVAFA